MTQRKRGLFITFEGGEGAGKSTLIRQLAGELKKRGEVIVTTREPGGSSLGQQVRDWLLLPKETNPLTSKAELLLFLADRAQHIEEIIRPALEEGKIVLCDRFNDSTIAYQGYGRQLNIENVQKLCTLVTENLVPDLTYLLDLPPEDGLLRAKKEHKQEAGSGNLDRIEAETLAFHERLREGFRELAQQSPERIAILNALKTPQEVLEAALTIWNQRF